LRCLEPCKVNAKFLYGSVPFGVLGFEAVDVYRLLSELGTE
jgi:hypothetical protein